MLSGELERMINGVNTEIADLQDKISIFGFTKDDETKLNEYIRLKKVWKI